MRAKQIQVEDSASSSSCRTNNVSLWPASNQVRDITRIDGPVRVASARAFVNELRATKVRVDCDFGATPSRAKFADAEQTHVHPMLVIGPRDMEAGAVSVRLHHGGPQGAKPKV